MTWMVMTCMWSFAAVLNEELITLFLDCGDIIGFFRFILVKLFSNEGNESKINEADALTVQILHHELQTKDALAVNSNADFDCRRQGAFSDSDVRELVELAERLVGHEESFQ